MIVDFKRLIDLYTKEGASTVFEKMCGDLLNAEDPAITPIRANPGDEGIDMLSNNNNRHTVYQCKYFVDQIEKSQKDQIRRSYNKARNYFGNNLEEWILIIPKDLDVKEHEWFQKWANKNQKSDGVKITYWGTPRLTNLLGNFSWVEDKYFQSGQVTILKEIIKQQHKIISTLEKGFGPSLLEPKLLVKTMSPIGDFCDFIPIIKPINNTSLDIEKPDYDIDKLVDLYSKFIAVDRINKICEIFEKKWSHWANEHSRISTNKKITSNSNYLIFTVVNIGNKPALDIDIKITFPDEVEIYTESEFDSLETEHKENRPKGPNEICEEIIMYDKFNKLNPSLRLNPQGYEQISFYNNNLLDNFTFPSVPNLVNNPVRNSIDISSDGKSAYFWLKKVKHNSDSDHHIDGIYIYCKEFKPDLQCEFYISLDNLPKPIEGVIPIVDKDDIWVKWDPFQ